MVSSEDNRLCIRDAATATLRRDVIIGDYSRAEVIEPSPSGRWVLFTDHCFAGGYDCVSGIAYFLKTWDSTTATRRELYSWSVTSWGYQQADGQYESGSATTGDAVVAFAVFPDSRRTVCLFDNGTTAVKDLESGTELARAGFMKQWGT